MWPPRISIRVALSLAFGTLVLALAAALVLVLERSRRTTTELVRQRTELIIGEVGERLRLHLDPAVVQAEFLLALVEQGDLDPNAEQAFVARLSAALAASPQVAALALIRTDYQQLRVERREGGAVPQFIDMRDVPGIDEVLEQTRNAARPRWGELAWSPRLRQPLVNLRTPIRRGGAFVGALFTTGAVTLPRGMVGRGSFERVRAPRA